jgi:hypothetical protein
MLALETKRKLKRKEWRCRGSGADAVALPLGRRPEAWIQDGAPHWVDRDLMPAEIVSAANHGLPLPEFDLPAGGEGKWPVVSGEWLVQHAHYAAQSNRSNPVKASQSGQSQSNRSKPVKASQTGQSQSNRSKPVKASQTGQSQSKRSNQGRPQSTWPGPNQTQSNPIKPNQSCRAENWPAGGERCWRIQLGQTSQCQSNQIKPNQTQSNLLREWGVGLPEAKEGGGRRPSQTWSNSVKPV